MKTFYLTDYGMLKNLGACYTGQKYSAVPNPSHLVDCGSLCVRHLECTGVNYRNDLKKCDLVYENTDTNLSLLEARIGCIFWKVMWRQ